ncbi:energy-coupling factor ABC transporter ATP-binding protein [Paenibacillus sp. YYML68]|uniref:energy-coupling factor ABC transporter ATP-binding protein n=1 Tax=Paenibacillus sp. YYML68 TaxID=2909250 RepID=UPI002493AD95|nr:ATP-binding cassette domain-containing protein [Paenibacillus sp. YYML68]
MHIHYEQVSYTYPGHRHDEPIIRELDLTVPSGQFVAWMGPNGSGKSTLAQMVNALIIPQQGHLQVGEHIVQRSKRNYRELRKRVGYVFQNNGYATLGDTIEDNIMAGLNLLEVTVAAARRKARQVLDEVGLPYESHAHRPLYTLHGILQRKAVLASVLAQEPRILVLDEFTAGLDAEGRSELLNVLQKVHQAYGCTILYITHRLEEALDYAERIVVLRGGHVHLDIAPIRVLDYADQLQEVGIELPPMMRLVQRLEHTTSFRHEHVKERDLIEQVKQYVAQSRLRRKSLHEQL